MKVLWLSSTNTLFNEKGDRSYNGKGWISSLQEAIGTFCPEISLAVAFLSEEEGGPISRSGVTYYKIKKRTPKGFKKLFSNWAGIYPENYDRDIRKIVNDFKPDIVHIFGCETKLASAVLSILDIPVIAHIQGLLNEYIKTFFPPDMKPGDFIIPSTFLNEVILKNGFIHLYEDYNYRAILEKGYLSALRFAMGRTEWDKSVIHRNSRAEYFHVDEVMREDFYKAAGKWSYKRHDGCRILSTISETPYKGLDVIMKCASILKKEGISFRWDVAGVREGSDIVKIFEKKYHISCTDTGISLLGIMSPESLVQTMLESDVYVHPSYIENSPNSVCEAQMVGVPVIAASGGGVPSLVNDNRTGLLFHPGDHVMLSKLVRHLISNASDAQRIGAEGAKEAAMRHDKAKIASELKAAYEKSISDYSRI